MDDLPLPSLLKLGTKEANGLHQYRLKGREPGGLLLRSGHGRFLAIGDAIVSQQCRLVGHLLANHAVAVPVGHVGIGWMIASYRSDSVGAGFGAGDAPVAVVVV